MKNSKLYYLCCAAAMMLFACESFKQENPVIEKNEEENQKVLKVMAEDALPNSVRF